MLFHHEVGTLQPCCHLFCRNAKPAVGMFFPQLFQIVGREIDNQQLAFWPQDTAGFQKGFLGFVQEVQHLVQGHHIGGRVAQGEGINV